MQKRFHRVEYKILVQLLKRFRTEAGINQVDLAQKLGVPQSYVSKVETGERKIDLVELEDICKALERDLTDFIGEYQKADRNWEGTDQDFSL